jgi:hypothetical protein
VPHTEHRSSYLDIGVSTLLEEELGDRSRPISARHVEGGAARCVLDVDVGSVGHAVLDNVDRSLFWGLWFSLDRS